MLERAHRLTRAADFVTATRRGRRAGAATLVVHLWTPAQASVQPDTARPARAGFVVGKPVGDAVTRNRVKRRLRHLVRARLETLPTDALLVVRALPAAGAAPTHQLAQDLDRALGRVLTPREGAR